MLPREATDDTEACLVVRDAGAAGGPIDVRWAGTEVRVRAPADATLAFEGVPVREAVALDAALKGFVGDLLGDYTCISKRLALHVDCTYCRTWKSSDTRRTGRPRNRTRAWCIQALSSIQGGIISYRGTSGGGIDETAWTGGFLDSWLGRRWGLRNDGRHHGLDKHAIAQWAVEIALALDAAIVFARLVLQLDPYPLAHLEACLASKAHGSFAAIV